MSIVKADVVADAVLISAEGSKAVAFAESPPRGCVPVDTKGSCWLDLDEVTPK